MNGRGVGPGMPRFLKYWYGRYPHLEQRQGQSKSQWMPHICTHTPEYIHAILLHLPVPHKDSDTSEHCKNAGQIDTEVLWPHFHKGCCHDGSDSLYTVGSTGKRCITQILMHEWHSVYSKIASVTSWRRVCIVRKLHLFGWTFFLLLQQTQKKLLTQMH